MLRVVRLRLFLAILAAAVCWPAWARAEERGSAVASLEPEELWVGEPALLRVVVDGVRSPGEPTLPAIDWAVVEALGPQDASSRTVTIVNGRRMEEVRLRIVFNYRLTPTRAGEMTLGPISVQNGATGGGALRTASLRAVVRKPGDAADFPLSLAVVGGAGERKPYVGEAVRVRLRWRLGGEVRGAQFTLPAGGSARVLPTDPPDEARSARVEEVPFNEASAAAWIDRETIDGRQHAVAFIDAVVVADKPGPITIGPASVAFNAVVGQAKLRSWIDEAFGGVRESVRRMQATSEPLALEATPLPEDGKPKDFSGLVGRPRLETFIDVRDAAVNEPFTLSLRITGVADAERAPAPDLKKIPAFTASFRLGPDEPTRTVIGGATVIRYELRPRNFRVNEIPSIALSYFDPDLGAYQTVASAPLPLRVLASRNMTTATIAPATERAAPGAGVSAASVRTRPAR